MSKKSQKLHVPLRKELIKEFLENARIDNADVVIGKFEESDLYVYNLVLRRLKLTYNLQQVDVFTYVNSGVGLFEEGALRLHLFLGCIEVIAGLQKSASFLDYSSWLNAKKSPYLEEKDSVVIPSNSTPIQIANIFHRQYLTLHGVRTHFYKFFHDSLTDEDKIKMLSLCWVLKASPLPNLYDLQDIQAGKHYDIPEFNVASKERSKWELLTSEKKLTQIAEALYAIRNLYTHSLVPYTSVQDKVPSNEQIEDGFQNRGDTVFVFEKGIAISFSIYPITEHIEYLVKAGLKNHIINKYVMN